MLLSVAVAGVSAAGALVLPQVSGRPAYQVSVRSAGRPPRRAEVELAAGREPRGPAGTVLSRIAAPTGGFDQGLTRRVELVVALRRQAADASGAPVVADAAPEPGEATGRTPELECLVAAVTSAIRTDTAVASPEHGRRPVPGSERAPDRQIVLPDRPRDSWVA
ncbi:MAG: hypothetical protein ACYCU5_12115 [Actinomycetes bacterium]